MNVQIFCETYSLLVSKLVQCMVSTCVAANNLKTRLSLKAEVQQSLIRIVMMFDGSEVVVWTDRDAESII